MKKYKVYVNGEPFEVVIEEAEQAAGAQQPAAPAPQVQAAPVSKPAAPAAPVAPPPAAEPAAPLTGGGLEVTAPMPGSILSINVEVGAQVNAGDTLLILEAMKMENEIAAPESGTVKSINVNVGSSVNTGDLMLVIE